MGHSEPGLGLLMGAMEAEAGGPGVTGSGPSFSAPSPCYLSLLQTNQDSTLPVPRYQHESEPRVRCSTRAAPQQTAHMQSGAACCTQSLGPGSVLPTAASLRWAVLGLQVPLMSKGDPPASRRCISRCLCTEQSRNRGPAARVREPSSTG